MYVSTYTTKLIMTLQNMFLLKYLHKNDTNLSSGGHPNDHMLKTHQLTPNVVPTYLHNVQGTYFNQTFHKCVFKISEIGKIFLT